MKISQIKLFELSQITQIISHRSHKLSVTDHINGNITDHTNLTITGLTNKKISDHTILP